MYGIETITPLNRLYYSRYLREWYVGDNGQGNLVAQCNVTIGRFGKDDKLLMRWNGFKDTWLPRWMTLQ